MCVFTAQRASTSFLFHAFQRFFFFQNVHVVARSLTDQLANREQLLASYLSQPSRREVENGRKAGAKAQIAGWSRTRRLSVAITSIRKCYTLNLPGYIFKLCLCFLPLLASFDANSG